MTRSSAWRQEGRRRAMFLTFKLLMSRTARARRPQARAPGVYGTVECGRSGGPVRSNTGKNAVAPSTRRAGTFDRPLHHCTMSASYGPMLSSMYLPPTAVTAPYFSQPIIASSAVNSSAFPFSATPTSYLPQTQQWTVQPSMSTYPQVAAFLALQTLFAFCKQKT